MIEFGLDPNDKTLYHCQSGVKIRLKSVSSVLTEKRGSSIPVPKVPMHRWRVEGEAVDREEPDYANPDYMAAIKDYNQRVSYVVTGTYLLFGTEIISLGDVEPCESEVWSRRLGNKATWGEDALDIPPDDDEHHDARYILWLTHVVLRDIEYKQVLDQIQILGGVVGEDLVQTAMRSFRSDEERPTDSGVAANRQQRRDNNRGTRRVRSK